MNTLEGYTHAYSCVKLASYSMHLIECCTSSFLLHVHIMLAYCYIRWIHPAGGCLLHMLALGRFAPCLLLRLHGPSRAMRAIAKTMSRRPLMSEAAKGWKEQDMFDYNVILLLGFFDLKICF